MVSVTRRIKYAVQPKGGFLPPKEFTVTELNDGQCLKEENVSPILVGLAVDYLTRFMCGAKAEDAFSISLKGAKILTGSTFLSSMYDDGAIDAKDLLSNIKGLDSVSIKSACKLVGFDVVYRAVPSSYRPIEEINADGDTVENIKIMVNRGRAFFEKYGPVVKDGFTFEGGYSALVGAGDGDFLTKDTLWDFKVSKKEPTNTQTLQLLMYYIMGKRSIHPEFKGIDKLGIFNPRFNKVYLYGTSKVDPAIIKEIEDNILCYDLTEKQFRLVDLQEEKKFEEYERNPNEETYRALMIASPFNPYKNKETFKAYIELVRTMKDT